MSATNNVILTGNTTKELEVRYSQGENPMTIARGTLAVSRGRKGKDGNYITDFLNFQAFGKTAESMEKNIGKGDSITITAELQNQQPYTNKDGKKVYPDNVITVNAWAFAGAKRNRSNEAEGAGSAGGGDYTPPYDDGLGGLY